MNAPGIISIGTTNYVERVQVFPCWLQNVATAALLVNQRVAIPGQYMFRLKALVRDTIVYAGGTSGNGIGTRTARPFLFRLGGSNDSSWFYGGSVPINTSGVMTDRVLDTNCFGNGQFAFPLAPTIIYPAGSQISFEVQDVSNNGNYDIHFGFIGAYLVPTDLQGNTLGSNG